MAKIRKLAFVNLDEALLVILDDTLSYLRAAGGELDPMTEKTWQYYRGLSDAQETE